MALLSMIDILELYNNSYERITTNAEGFFADFYRNFFNKSDSIRALFHNVDMVKQGEIVQDSFHYLLSFYNTKQVSDYLINLCHHHKNELVIAESLYDLWLDALLETVSHHDPHYDRETELAWRVVLAPGITLMKHYNPAKTV